MLRMARQPALWFWQVEGRQWQLDGKGYHIARRAWARMVADNDERRLETDAQYARTPEQTQTPPFSGNGQTCRFNSQLRRPSSSSGGL